MIHIKFYPHVKDIRNEAIHYIELNIDSTVRSLCHIIHQLFTEDQVSNVEIVKIIQENGNIDSFWDKNTTLTEYMNFYGYNLTDEVSVIFILTI